VEIIHSAKPLCAIAVSLVAVVLVALSSRKPNLREVWSILSALIKLAIVASMLPDVLDGKVIEYSLVTVVPGLDIKFRVDALGIAFAATASFLWVVTSFYAIGYMRGLKEHAQTRFFMCFNTTLAAAMGAAFAANMFTLFIFYEAITFCTFPLVAHKQTAEAIGGARKYITYLLGTSLAFQLFAIFLTYSTAGTLDFASQGILAGRPTGPGHIHRLPAYRGPKHIPALEILVVLGLFAPDRHPHWECDQRHPHLLMDFKGYVSAVK